MKIDTDKEVQLKNNKDRDKVYNKFSEEQKIMFHSIQDNIFTFCEATSGAGKTIVTIASMLDLLANNKINKIIYIQKASDRYLSQGFLPGTLEEKTDALWTPFYDAMITLGYMPDSIMKLIKFEQVMLTTDSNLRGVNFENAGVCLDECIDGKARISIENDSVSLDTLYLMHQNGKQLPKVLTFNESTKTIEYKQIKYVKYKGEKETRTIRFSNGFVRCTDNHPFLTVNGWKRADELNIGDILISSCNNGYTSITEVINDRKVIPVYDLEIEDNHNFCVISSDGIFAHNCENMDIETLRLIFTRCHDSCHVVMIGDSKQKDNKGNKTGDFISYGNYLANSSLGNKCILTKNFRGKFSQLAETFEG